MLYQMEIQIAPLDLKVLLVPDETEKYEALIDCCIAFLSGGNRDKKFKNIEMAKAKFDVEFFKQRLWQLHDECDRAKLTRRQEYDLAFSEAIKKLPREFYESEIDTTELPRHQIIAEKKRVQLQRQESIERKKDTLKQQDNQHIDEVYQRAIGQCEEKLAEAWECYRQAGGDGDRKEDSLVTV